MITRIAVAAVVLLAVGASPLRAQGTAPEKKVVISPTVLKSMTAQKPKSKTPLSARVGMKRAPTPAVVASRDTVPPAPTSVRAVKKIER